MAKSAAGGMLMVGLPVKLDRLSWSDWELGLYTAVTSATYMAVCLGYSLLLHRMPLRRMLGFAAGLAAAMAAGLWLFTFGPLLFLFGAGFSFAAALYWPSLMAWIGESEETHLVGDMSAFNCAWTISLTAGAVVGGLVESLIPGLSLLLVAAVLAALMLLAPFAHIRGRDAFPATVASEPVPPVLPRRFLAAGWLAAMIATLATAVPASIFIKLNSSLGYAARDFGAFLGLQGAVQAFVFLALGVLQGWRYRRWPLVAPLVFVAAGGLLLATPTGGGTFGWYVLALGFALLGAGMGLGYGTGFYYTVRGGRRRKRNVGLFEAAVSLQHVLGGAAGGLTATLLWRRAPYLAVAGLAVLGILAQGSLLRGLDQPAPRGPNERAFDTPRGAPYNSGPEGGPDARAGH